MLVCNVSQLRRRAAIAADLAEAAVAVDATAIGNVVFATLVDDPASVGELVDAFLGEIMLEAASAADSFSASVPSVFTADVVEAGAASDSSSSTLGITDPSFANVKLLMGFDGADGATGAPGMTDESSAAHGNAGINGNAQIDTAQSVFGGSSLLLDGSGDSITFADHADFNLSTVPFTIECRIRPASVSFSGFIIDQWLSPVSGWALYQVNATLGFHVSTTGSDDIGVIDTASILSANTWHAVCVDFDGSKYRMYLNGTMVGSSTTLRTIFNSTNPLVIGACSPNQIFYNGWIDELRLTKGTARYASDAGYTVATAAFPRS